MNILSLIPIAREAPTADWIFFVLMGCLLMVCICSLLFTKNVYTLHNRTEYMSYTDNNTFLFSMLINVLNLVLFSLLIVSYFHISFSAFQTPFTGFSIVLGIISAVMLVKVCLEILFHKAFYAEQDFKFFINSSSYINARNVLVLLSLSFLFFYSPIPKTYIVLLAGILLIVNRLWELFYRYFTQKNNISQIWYHNILYLCTLEILPVLVLIKLLYTGKVI